MPIVRMIISAKKSVDALSKDAFVNTLYFNVSGSFDDPDYTSLTNDLFTIWSGKPWAKGCYVDIRAYDMSDVEPRPVKARKMEYVTGTRVEGVQQVALALSYYADRNLPGMRGRIFVGPWVTTNSLALETQTANLISLAPQLAGLGGLNVDWSLYSPSRNDATRITNAWVDNSWDIIRSRKIPGTTRATWSGNG